ncbi:MAG: endonuclease III [Clostridiaceae bacterium]|nr:endonuclease III [Clostridiales bacterium]MDD6876781.1 endonuclease III [Clostridiaceae bacterium]MDY3071561.1 endonuclease III [Eubacteriales bacterium]MDY3287227.1 endonuclease III [Eubacteriales bacterium]MDY5015338.1 endonuclease III [Eubacteriales bacterium]
MPKTDPARVRAILDALAALYPDPVCALRYGKPYELLFAVILSAQCTDARVNMITPALFEKYPSLEAFAGADIADVEECIRSCGFYHTKARAIVETAGILLDSYGGELPDTLEELVKLPGVGRKTANLILGDVYRRPGAVVTDTHCIRIANRLELCEGREPEKVERALREVLPPEESSDFCHRLVLHGRALCTARRPDCAHCPLYLSLCRGA